MTAEDTAERARRLLVDGLRELQLALTDAQIDALLALALLLERWSKRVNLTGHETAVEIVQRLVLDAAALCSVLPEVSTLVDIGSGAGFPGLPIAILRTRCEVTLVESRERRHHFQREAIRKLGLANVRAEHGRAEDLKPAEHAAAIAQAVARPADVLPLLLPWVEVGGLLLFPGSSPAPPLPEADPRVRFESCESYDVPLGGPARTLWIARKTPAATR